DLRAFGQQGLDALCRPRRVGAPARLTATQVAAIWHLAEAPPYEVGLPYGRWSLSKLRAHLIRQRLLPAISREHLRRLLKNGASPSGGCGAREPAPTPGGERSWPASGPAGGTGPAAAYSCSSTSSRSRSRPTAAGATPGSGGRCCPCASRRAGASTCSWP